MKKYSRVFRYVGQYKSEAFLYILFISLSIIFSLVSLGTLFPFLELIFNGDQTGVGSLAKGSTNPIVVFVRNFLIDSITNNGKIRTLGLICLVIITSIFLKNVFLYLAYR